MEFNFIFILALILNFYLPAFGAADVKTDAKYAPGLKVTKNFVLNPDCEKNVLNITKSVGTLSTSTSSPLVAGAGTQCSWSPGAAGTLKFDIGALSPHVKSGNCEVNFFTGTTTSGQYRAWLEYDSVRVSDYLAVNATTAGQKFQILYPCSTTATTRKFVLESLGASSAITIGGVEFGAGYVPAVYLTQGPTITKLTTGTNATYTTPANVLYIRIRMVGGGGGGGGASGNTGDNGGTGGTGTATLWKTADGVSTILVANGGSGGTGSAGATAGGTAGVNSPAIGSGFQGSGGSPGCVMVVNTYCSGGNGAPSVFGGGGIGGYPVAAGGAAVAVGAGGGGGSSGPTANVRSGSGGAAGAYVDAIINNPSATYMYTVGSAGGGGTAGTNGTIGGAGGNGYIEVTEFYQ